MTFAQYFKASSYCLIASGFMAVASTGAVDGISLVFFASVLVGSWFMDTGRLRQKTPIWLLNGAAVASLLFFAADIRLLSRSFPVSIVHFVFLIAAIKLFTLSKDRDYALLYLISFALLLAASILTVNIFFGVWYLAFLFSGIISLVLFEMRRSNARMQSRARVQPLVTPRKLQGTGFELFSPFPSRLLSGMMTGITLLVLLLAVPLFFLLPRMNLGLYKPPLGNTQFLTGFSERVELGRMGTILQSDALVMRVRISRSLSGLPAGLKWRGLSFDFYDGRSWSRSDLSRSAIPTQGRYYKLETTTQGTDWIDQTFFIEALSTDVIFAAHKALAVSRDVGALQRDFSENLFASRRQRSKLRYSAISDPILPDPAKISDLSPVPAQILETYLQLPFRNARISDLATIAAKPAATKYGKALAIEKYLRSHYTYSLELRGDPGAPDPLAMFLFDTRRGHCEYFASAMVLMLRHIGIPARLVNGFRMGEYNRLGNDFIVRQYDAHSWVEAFFPPYGWIEFDPTPASPQHPQSAFARMAAYLSDAIDLWWWEGVVNYDASKQYQMIGHLQERMDRLWSSLADLLAWASDGGRRVMERIHSPNPAAGLERGWIRGLPWAAVALLLVVRPLRRRVALLIRSTWYRNNARRAAGSYYGEALEMLAAHGMKRACAETPLEFAHRIGDHPAGPSLRALTRLYNAARYGPPDASWNPAEAREHLSSMRIALHVR